jgi:hypothetical protein
VATTAFAAAPIAHWQGLMRGASTSIVPNSKFNRQARASFREPEGAGNARNGGAPRILGDPSLNQKPLDARQRRLAVVKWQVQRVERRVGIGATLLGQ